MRFTGTAKNNDGSETTVYIFKANADEWGILLDLAIELRQKLPRSAIEFMPIRNRLINIIKEIADNIPKRNRRKLADSTRQAP
jgi:hypothetical protein